MNFPGQENYVSDNSDSAVNLKIISADRNTQLLRILSVPCRFMSSINLKISLN